MAAEDPSPLPALVVHFDVNKTVLCTDQAGGKSQADVLNSIASDYSLGVVDGATGKWELKLKPGEDGPRLGLVSYSEFIEDSLPYQPEPADATKEAIDALRKVNAATRVKRQDIKVRFTQPGEPGETCAELVKQWDAALAVPPESLEACKQVEFLASGSYHLIPAYFATLEALATDTRQACIVFRTFGSDLPHIIKEHNMYCEGSHPAFPKAQPLDGSVPGRPDMRLTSKDTGRFQRYMESGEPVISLAIMSQHGSLPAVVDVVTGAHNVSHAILTHLGVSAPASHRPPKHSMMALRDDYAYWHHAGEVGEAGKLLLVDPQDTTVHSVFFDDNVGEEEACIVDARHAETGEALPFDLTKDVFIIRCNIGDALLDPGYFLEKIAKSQALRAERHDALVQLSGS